MNKLPDRIRIKDIARLAGVSVGTVDRVLHGRPGVSPTARESVENVLSQLDYHPNMYASAMASNRKYRFLCLIPAHKPGSYWCDIEQGLRRAGTAYSDFHVTIETVYFNPYNPGSFADAGDRVIDRMPDGVVLSPTSPEHTRLLVEKLKAKEIPYIFIDSNIADLEPMAFFGQHSVQSGFFAGSMMSMVAKDISRVVIFRQISRGEQSPMNQQSRRETGFRNYMTQHHPDCHIYELDVDIAFCQEDITALLDSFFAAHPEVKMGVTFNSQVGIFGDYIAARGIKDFCLLGYDVLERNVKCLREGSVQFLIAQKPFMQGYAAVEAFSQHFVLHKDPEPLNYVSIDLLTAHNIDYYQDERL